MSSASDSLRSAAFAEKAAPVVRAFMDLLIGVFFVALAAASYHRFVASGSVLSFGVLAVNCLFVGLYLIRRPAASETTSLKLWVLAFAGSVISLLLRPSARAGSATGYAIQLIGLVVLAGALLSLRRSFAIVPGNRGVIQNGLYRFVRHPVYLAELIVVLGVTLANPTFHNAAIWICECALQLARARAEERFLSADPVYRAYCTRVRYRLVPPLI